ncbi:hypothetical protein [Methanolacinia paynteri]|uniref:hypothetical protein n=1 Tax=Methanolacinia paynteri TaxID=230356 RepID=UPI00064F321C|nr:hypothetical protein [Methanolacinia paynteri]
MKKISFGKATLLVFMILAAGAVLAMPVSANTQPIGPYDVTADGDWISSSSDQFQALGKAESIVGDVDWITVRLTVSNTRFSFGPFSETSSGTWLVSTGYKTYQDTQEEHRSHVITTKLTSSTSNTGYVRYTLS